MNEPMTEGPEALDPAGQARALMAAAAEHAEAERYDEAVADYEAALALWRTLGEGAAVAAALDRLANTRWDMGHLEASLGLYGEAAQAFRAAGDPAGEAQALYAAGACLATLGRLDEAEATVGQAADLWRDGGLAGPAARAETRRARLLWRLDRREEAMLAMGRAIADRQTAGDEDSEEAVTTLQQQLARMRAGVFPEAQWGAILPADEVEALIQNTVAVLTVMPERRDEWRAAMSRARDDALARGGGWQVEVELFGAVLSLLDDGHPQLPAGHPYAPALAAIRTGVASGGPAELPVARDVVEAVRVFVGTEDWTAAQRVVESHQELLLRPEVDMLFERNIDSARAAGDARGARVLALHRDVLRACRAEGVEAGFAWLRRTLAEADAGAQAAGAHEALPPDFVDRCASAFLGSANDKVALFAYLRGLGTFDPDVRPLTDALGQALFIEDPEPAGRQLAGAHADVWRAVMARVSRGDHER
jgi:tetratricopeptide (TPR) repeat protein